MANDLSSALRDILIEHIDGPAPFDPHNVVRSNRVRVAVHFGLLRFDSLTGPQCARPRQSVITDKGREKLAQALAEWADAIVLARSKI